MGLPELIKKYGSQTIRQGAAVSRKLKLRSGIFSLDLVLGGGWPVGRASMPWGLKSAGKSTAAAKTVANFQKTCIKCWQRPCTCKRITKGLPVVIDNENNIDDQIDWFQKLGVDTGKDALYIVQADTFEDSLDIAYGVLEDDRVGLIILDSVAMGASDAELDPRKKGASVAESTHAQRSQTFTRWTRKMNAAMSREIKRGHLFVILLLNQARANMNTLYGGPTLMAPGGKALEGFCPVILQLAAAKSIYGEGEKPDELPPLATVTNIYVNRNKIDLCVMQGQYEMMLRDKQGYPTAGNPNDWELVTNHGKRLGYIEQVKGGWRVGAHTYPKFDVVYKVWQTQSDIFYEDSTAVMGLVLADMRRPR